MRRKKHKEFNEVAYRYGVICEYATWILADLNEETVNAIGENGIDSLLAFQIQRRRDV
jgi:hypothetical protein